MESRFVVPVIVSTTLYALVYVLGNNPTHSLVVTDPATVLLTPLPPVPPVPPVVDENPPLPDDRAEVSHGRLEVFTPQLDNPAPNVKPDVYYPPIPRLPSTEIAKLIPDGPIGDPNSKVIGRSGVPVISSRLLDNPPRTRSQVAPAYPSDAKISGTTGEVVVEFIVDEIGRVLNPRVVRATDPRFEVPTLRAVEKWRFEPGKREGQAVRFRMMVPVLFSLDR